jgi:hypothetical protein
LIARNVVEQGVEENQPPARCLPRQLFCVSAADLWRVLEMIIVPECFSTKLIVMVSIPQDRKLNSHKKPDSHDSIKLFDEL